MAEWHRTWRGDLGLRALGSGACALSYVLLARLPGPHGPDPAHDTPGLATFLLTAAAFLCASAGSAMAVLGAHLFDRIVVSERWRVKPDLPGFGRPEVGRSDVGDADAGRAGRR